MSLLRELLIRAAELDASDIHLKVNEQAIFRVHANLVESGSPIITGDTHPHQETVRAAA
jgi:Tfp pilus assembly pilus retraction ATPase PilT